MITARAYISWRRQASAKRGWKGFEKKNCPPHTPRKSMCQSAREPPTRTPLVEFLHVVALFLSPSLPRATAAATKRSAARARCNANEWPCHVHAHCNSSFRDRNPTAPTPPTRRFMSYALLVITIIIHTTYKYNIILCSIHYIIIIYVQRARVWVCAACLGIYLHVLLYIYIYIILCCT